MKMERDPQTHNANGIQGVDNDGLDQRLVRALESAPLIAVPGDFALRVAAKLPDANRADGPVLATSVGRRVAWTAAALLLVVILLLAPSSAQNLTRRWLELALELEFIALTAWLTLRPWLQP